MKTVQRPLVCQNPRCGKTFHARFPDQRRFCSTACRHNFKYPKDKTSKGHTMSILTPTEEFNKQILIARLNEDLTLSAGRTNMRLVDEPELGESRECTHVSPEGYPAHLHGSASAYNKDMCRCEPCCNARYAAMRAQVRRTNRRTA